MQYVVIKEEIQDGKLFYTVSAIPLKNKNKAVVQKIPHPLGGDVLSYNTLEQAKEAILLAGFSYVLPNGEKGHKKILAQKTKTQFDSYETMIYETIKDKVNSDNSNVVATALLALSEFPREETFDILFEKMGEDNETIRKNAISGICRYANILQDRIIDSLRASGWVVRNSALSCIQKIAEDSDIDLEKFIIPLSEICEDDNTIVQANALTTLAVVFRNYKKFQKI